MDWSMDGSTESQSQSDPHTANKRSDPNGKEHSPIVYGTIATVPTGEDFTSNHDYETHTRIIHIIVADFDPLQLDPRLPMQGQIALPYYSNGIEIVKMKMISMISTFVHLSATSRQPST